MAMDYRNQILSEIEKFKNSQPELINNFISDLMDSTAILSDAKVNEFIDFVLGNGELVNSVIQFALAEDFSIYTKPIETAIATVQKEVEETVSELTAPLSVVKYHGSVEETFEKIIYDRDLRNLLEMFLPAEQIDEYVAIAEEYYALYEEYYGMYEEILDMSDELGSTFASLSFSAESIDSIESTVATLQNKIFRNARLINLVSDYIPTDSFEEIADMIDEYVALYHEYMDLYNDTLDSIASSASEIDTEFVNEYADLALEYLAQTEDAKELIVDAVSQVDTQLIKDLVHYFENFGQFGRDFIDTLPEGSYEVFRDTIDNLDLYQADIIALTEDFNTSSVAKNIDVIKQTNKFLDDVITKLENKEILDAVDVLMNEDFSDYQFEVVNLLPSYEIEFEAVE
jgi:methyl-accepting chemotaxis protein